MQVVLVTRQGCHLCDQALIELRSLGFEPELRDVVDRSIQTDPHRQEYTKMGRTIAEMDVSASADLGGRIRMGQRGVVGRPALGYGHRGEGAEREMLGVVTMNGGAAGPEEAMSAGSSVAGA